MILTVKGDITSFFGFFLVLLCFSSAVAAASNLREGDEITSISTNQKNHSNYSSSTLQTKRSNRESANSKLSAQKLSVSPTSISSLYKHVTKILPKFAPSCAPSQPPFITSFQNLYIRFYTPINYFQSNPTANLAQLEPQQEVCIYK